MKNLNINSKKGFTIIEVVLVLAIAGLIFLMVFVALPNLQRSQKDTQRRNELDRLSTSIIQYITNNNKLPARTGADTSVEYYSATGGSLTNVTVNTVTASSTQAWAKFYWNYLLSGGEDTFEDPNGFPYVLAIASCNTTTEGACNNAKIQSTGDLLGSYNGAMVVVINASCGSEDNSVPFNYAKGTRKFAVAMRLEGSGLYCVDN